MKFRPWEQLNRVHDRNHQTDLSHSFQQQTSHLNARLAKFSGETEMTGFVIFGCVLFLLGGVLLLCGAASLGGNEPDESEWIECQ